MSIIKNSKIEYSILFTEKGKGAYLNGKSIHVSDIPFENAIVSYGTSPYDVELARRTMKLAEQFLLRAGDLRRTGSAAGSWGAADSAGKTQKTSWDAENRTSRPVSK